MSFTIKIDYRENRGSDVISTLSELRSNNFLVDSSKYNIVVENLTVGDFILYCGNYALIIERKTLPDLASSISDRRIYRNHEKLIGVKFDDITTRVVYMIEGDRKTDPDTKICNIKFSSLCAKLDHLMMTDGCIIDWTDNCAVRLLEMGKNMLTIKNIDMCKNIASAIGGATKKKFEVSVFDTQRAILCCINFIGNKTADKILAQNNLKDIFTDARDMKGITPKITTEILNFCEDPPESVAIAMLTQIKGVSQKTAKIILDFMSILDCIKNTDVDAIASIEMTERRKIGKALAFKIVNTFQSENNPVIGCVAEDSN